MSIKKTIQLIYLYKFNINKYNVNINKKNLRLLRLPKIVR